MFFFRDFLSLVYPEQCITCENILFKNEKEMCTRCLSNLPYSGYVNKQHNPLEERFWGKVTIKKAFSYLKFTKKGITQKLLYSIKYDGNRSAGKLFGAMFGKEISESGLAEKVDIIIPVPLHKVKLKKRGFNQSEAIACGISAQINLPVIPYALQRIKNKKSQTNKGRLRRWEDIKDNYILKHPGLIRSCSILLVDDVITTGATTETCVRLLLEGGADSVYVCCLASAEY